MIKTFVKGINFLAGKTLSKQHVFWVVRWIICIGNVL